MNISAEEYRGPLRLDPRTKLLYVFTVGCFCLTLAGGEAHTAGLVRAVLALSPFLLLLVSGRIRAGVAYTAIVAACYLFAWLALPHLTGVISWFCYASIAICTQMMPSAMAAYWMLSTTTASELVDALQRMHVPQAITIPIAVMFRFFPTALEEQRNINDAMTMRGVRFGGGKASEILEYRVVPLIVNSVRIADELSQAALTRGLGAGRRRTSIADVGFHAADVVLALLCAVCFGVWIAVATGVLG